MRAGETRRTRWWSFLLAVLLGAAGGYAMCLSFPAASHWYLMFPGVAVLFWLLLDFAPGAAFWGSVAWACAFFIPLITWIVDSTKSITPWLALAGVQITWVALWALLCLRARRRQSVWGNRWLYALLLPVTFVGIEQARAHFPWHGFAWGLLGYAQVDSPLKRFIPWLGEVGMSLLIAFLALALTLIIARSRAIWERISSLSVLALFLVLSILMPNYFSDLPAADTNPQSLRVSAVQGNVSGDYPADLNDEYRILNNNVKETDLIEKRPDLVVWGEQSADIDPRKDSLARDLVNAAARRIDAPILVGTVPVIDEKYRLNDIFLVYPDGEFSASYTKQRPVPFGEYIPAREIFAKLSKDVAQVPLDMRAGNKPALITLKRNDGKDVPLAVGICFEVAIDSVMRQGIAHGGQLLIVPTNNASFGHSDESVQQLQMVQFRALEYHRAAVSSSINGVSALIDANGKIIAKTELFTAAHIGAQLPLYRDYTPAYYLQPYAPTVIMLVTGGWALLVLIMARKR